MKRALAGEKVRNAAIAMKTPETSRLFFTPGETRQTGWESYILTERPAPVQQSFYYTHPSFTEDGRFLWVGFGYPPPGGRHAQQVLGVVDFETDEVRVYPETQFPSSRPLGESVEWRGILGQQSRSLEAGAARRATRPNG